MKVLNLTKQLTLFLFLLLVFSCSNEIEFKSENIEGGITLPNSSISQRCTSRPVNVTYNFPFDITNGVYTLISEEEQNTRKEEFINYMSRFFTIYEVIDDINCSNLGVWVVNCNEYQAYIDLPSYAGTNNEEINQGELGVCCDPTYPIDLYNPYCGDDK